MNWADTCDAFLAAHLDATLVSEQQARDQQCRGIFRELRKCFFEEGVSLESPVLGERGGVLLGAHSYMNDGGYIRPPLVVGRFCSIGRRVSLNAGGHRMSALSTSPVLRGAKSRGYSVEEAEFVGHKPRVNKATIIGHDVWIGDGAVVLPGVAIGSGAVIGANAVVSRDVPAHGVVAGLPARQLRLRFPLDLSLQILESQFWEYPLAELNSIDCTNAIEFLEAIKTFSPPTGAYSVMSLS